MHDTGLDLHAAVVKGKYASSHRSTWYLAGAPACIRAQSRSDSITSEAVCGGDAEAIRLAGLHPFYEGDQVRERSRHVPSRAKSVKTGGLSAVGTVDWRSRRLVPTRLLDRGPRSWRCKGPRLREGYHRVH